MFKAFFNKEAYVEGSNVNCFFKDYYPYPEDWIKYANTLQPAYEELKQFISDTIDNHFDPEKNIPIPSWIYSYMLMRPIAFESNEIDIAYLYNLLDAQYRLSDYPDTRMSGEFLFTEDMAYWCYKTSSDWILRNPSKNYNRPATIFGETHVTKSLRLAEASIFIADEG